MLLTQAHADLGPPILAGHAVDANNQVVLGSATLAALHKKIGDTVMVSYGAPKDAPVYVPPSPMVIVGTATMPAIGVSGHLHPSMGTGALLPTGLEPAAFKRALTQPDPNLNGPSDGRRPAQERRDARRGPGVAATHRRETQTRSWPPIPTVRVTPTRCSRSNARPRSSTTNRPAPLRLILATGLAAGALVALGLTLAASVRRRRRDLALFKTFGFTHRQLAAAVAWQASVVAVIGILVGVPVGIIVGRWLWILFADAINAVPYPSVSVVDVLLVALGTLVLAHLAALIPGRMAARTPTALVLRAE